MSRDIVLEEDSRMCIVLEAPNDVQICNVAQIFDLSFCHKIGLSHFDPSCAQ